MKNLFINKYIKDDVCDLLFYISYGVFLAASILSASFYYIYFMGLPYKVIKYFCVGILLIRELFITQKYTKKTIGFIVIFTFFIAISWFQSSSSTIAYILIFLFCARNIDFKKIAKLSLWISSLAVFVIVASAYCGIITNYKEVTIDNRIRYYLGFRYSLYCPAFFFNISSLFLYLRNEKVKWIELSFLAFINYWVFMKTNSRLSFYLSIILIILFGILKLNSQFHCGIKQKRSWAFLLVFSFVLGFVISVGFTIGYDEDVSWQKQLNKVMGNRLYYGQQSLENSGINLFGQELIFVGNGLDAYGIKNTEESYNYVDSFYVQVLQRFGMLFMVFWIGLLTITLYRYYKLKDYPMMLCLSLIAVHCIIDDLPLYLQYNTFWFSCTIVFSDMRTLLQHSNLYNGLVSNNNRI